MANFRVAAGNTQNLEHFVVLESKQALKMYTHTTMMMVC